MSGLVLKFPTNVEMDAVTQEFKPDTGAFIGASILPAVPKNSQRVEWFELDSVRGRTSVHTMDTDPKVKGRPGAKLKSYEPVPHKEAKIIKESEILKSRDKATLGGVITLDDLVMEAWGQAMIEDETTMEVERWAAINGALNINDNGVVISETFPVQEFTPTTQWKVLADATPLKDLNAMKLMFRGTGASAKGARFILNQATFNKMLENKNADDLRGFNVDNLRSAAFDLEQFNRLLSARGLPNFEIYDEGWINDNGDFVTFIADGKGYIVGRRPAGQNVGDYVMTPSLHRNVNGQAAPGRFAFVTVNDDGGDNIGSSTVGLAQLGANGNPNVKVIHGVYGGPRILYPRSIIKVNCYTPD